MANLRRARSVFATPSDGGYLVYDVRSGALQQLNPLASLVLELCDGTRDADGLRPLVVSITGEDAWPACREWIDAALHGGLLEAVSGADPEPVTAPELVRMAGALQDEGKLMPAFICLQNAADLEPGEPGTWYRLAILALRLDRRDVAREAFQHCAELAPGDAEVEHLLTAVSDASTPSRASDAYVQSLFDRFASYYDENMCESLGFQAPELLADAIMAALAGRTALNVLDLGCGTGLSGVPLRPIASKLTGVDLSPNMIARAEERRVYDDLHVAEITAFLEAAAGAPYDVIAVCDTFVYFGDLKVVVSSAARCLAPGGVLGFTVELGDRYPVRLTDSGRFTHHPQHVAEVARGAGLALVGRTEPVLRSEYGNPVRGIVAVMQRL